MFYELWLADYEGQPTRSIFVNMMLVKRFSPTRTGSVKLTFVDDSHLFVTSESVETPKPHPHLCPPIQVNDLFSLSEFFSTVAAGKVSQPDEDDLIYGDDDNAAF